MNPRGSGVLILVVGPSGSGKDTLLNAARNQLASDPRFLFPKRMITRQETTGEDHFPVTESEFRAHKEQQRFLLWWEAHGLSYGIPISVEDDLRTGHVVLVNASRRSVDEARMKWTATEVIMIRVEPHVLRERLLLRGRENADDIENRVKRASDETYAPTGQVHIIDNSKPLVQSSQEFIGLIRRLVAAHEEMTTKYSERGSINRFTDKADALGAKRLLS